MKVKKKKSQAEGKKAAAATKAAPKATSKGKKGAAKTKVKEASVGRRSIKKVYDKYPVSQLLRWMGVNNMTALQGKKVLEELGYTVGQGGDVAEMTVRSSIAHGRQGYYEPASLTSKEAAEIRRIAKPYAGVNKAGKSTKTNFTPAKAKKAPAKTKAKTKAKAKAPAKGKKKA